MTGWIFANSASILTKACLWQVAYVPQSAFIYNATVRENILFGQPFDQHRYEQAIKASAVGPDIDNMPGELGFRV